MHSIFNNDGEDRNDDHASAEVCIFTLSPSFIPTTLFAENTINM